MDPKVMLEHLGRVPEDEILKIEHVSITIPENDIPGMPKHKTVCTKCGERIMDGREVMRGGIAVCKACAEGAYYRVV